MNSFRMHMSLILSHLKTLNKGVRMLFFVSFSLIYFVIQLNESFAQPFIRLFLFKRVHP